MSQNQRKRKCTVETTDIEHITWSSYHLTFEQIKHSITKTAIYFHGFNERDMQIKQMLIESHHIVLMKLFKYPTAQNLVQYKSHITCISKRWISTVL